MLIKMKKIQNNNYHKENKARKKYGLKHNTDKKE
jgi:hypothetical protein